MAWRRHGNSRRELGCFSNTQGGTILTVPDNFHLAAIKLMLDLIVVAFARPLPGWTENFGKRPR
jgi:hypothetical protein